MGDRVYKGKLTTETSPCFDESAPAFDTPGKMGLIPFEVLRRALVSDKMRCKVDAAQKGVWILAGDISIRISRDGTVEIVSAGA